MSNQGSISLISAKTGNFFYWRVTRARVPFGIGHPPTYTFASLLCQKRFSAANAVVVMVCWGVRLCEFRNVRIFKQNQLGNLRFIMSIRTHVAFMIIPCILPPCTRACACVRVRACACVVRVRVTTPQAESE